MLEAPVVSIIYAELSVEFEGTVELEASPLSSGMITVPGVLEVSVEFEVSF